MADQGDFKIEDTLVNKLDGDFGAQDTDKNIISEEELEIIHNKDEPNMTLEYIPADVTFHSISSTKTDDTMWMPGRWKEI